MFSRFLKKNKGPIANFEEKRIFLNDEEIFFGRLRRALPNCYIFPKIELSTLMEPANSDFKQRQEAMDQLKDRHIDYAICDASLNLLCVIELTTANSANGDEDEIPNIEYLKIAAIKCIRWNKHPLPSAEQILRTLAPFSSLESPNIKEKRVLGAMGAIEVHYKKQLEGFQKFAYDNGVWLRPIGNIVYLMPPYIISEKELRKILDVFKKWFHKIK